jgi:hypothetical protein
MAEEEFFYFDGAESLNSVFARNTSKNFKPNVFLLER